MRLIDEIAYQYKIAKIPMEERTFVRAWETAQNMPTIDAAPVVRCGECKFRNTSWYDKRDVLESFCRWDRDESPNDDDYCSYGERKESEGST